MLPSRYGCLAGRPSRRGGLSVGAGSRRNFFEPVRFHGPFPRNSGWPRICVGATVRLPLPLEARMQVAEQVIGLPQLLSAAFGDTEVASGIRRQEAQAMFDFLRRERPQATAEIGCAKG